MNFQFNVNLFRRRSQPTRTGPRQTAKQELPKARPASHQPQPGPIQALKKMATNRHLTQLPVWGLRNTNNTNTLQTRYWDAFQTPEQKTSLAIALSHSHNASNEDPIISTDSLEQLFPDLFSPEEAQDLADKMNRARVHLQAEPLLNQDQGPGLVFAVRGRKKSLAAHKIKPEKRQRIKDLQQVMAVLKEKAISPKLYTGHKLGGELAQLAHQIMEDKEAVSLTFDTPNHKNNNTHGLCQINVPIAKKSRQLGRLIQESKINSLLETAKKAQDTSSQLKQKLQSATPTEGRIRSLAKERLSGSPPPADIPLSQLSLAELFRCDPIVLAQKIGKCDEPRSLNLEELFLLTDLDNQSAAAKGGYPSEHQALLLRYTGQLYKAIDRGPEAFAQFIDQLFAPPEVTQALINPKSTTQTRALSSLLKGMKEQLEKIDLNELKPMLALEIRRQAQAYSFNYQTRILLTEANNIVKQPAEPPTSASNRQLARLSQQLYELAEQALNLYRETGYLRLLTGHGGNSRHATAFVKERVQTDRGEENLAVLFDSSDNAHLGQFKTPATHTVPSRYVSRGHHGPPSRGGRRCILLGPAGLAWLPR